MSNDQELAADVARQAGRLAAQLDAHQRDLEAKHSADGPPLVQSAREAVEQLMRDLRSRSGS